MLVQYLPILVFFVLALTVGLALLLLPRVLGPRNPSAAKATPYESGIARITPFSHRFPIKFYVTAMLFIVFDIEVVFFYPWAVAYRQLGLFGLVELLVFVAILLVGYVWAWRRGAFNWE